MRKPVKFSQTRPDGKRYLRLLNDAEAFALEAGVTDSDVVAALRSHAATMRALAVQQREIARRAQQVLKVYRSLGTSDREGDVDLQLDLEEELGATTVRTATRRLQDFTKGMDVLRIMRDTATGLTIRRSRVARQKLVKLLKRLNVGPTGRIAICHLCDLAFYWSPKRRAQKFCPRCQRRWSPQQRWYRAKHKGKSVRERQKRSMGGERA